MKKFKMNLKNENIIKASLILLMIVVGVGLRFSSEIPNFTPMFAIALFSGYFFRNKIIAITTPLIIQIVTDYFLGFHADMFAVYASFALISLVGMINRDKYSFGSSVSYSVVSAFMFYLITNFSVWLTADFYSKDFNGLVSCYTLALPFFKNTLISSVSFSTILFGIYSLILKTDYLNLVKSK
jgi:hypothetical protein